MAHSELRDRQWFALYVKPRHETHIGTLLHEKGFEVFVPTYRHRVKYNKSYELPLFPGYVFCRFELSTKLPVIITSGVFFIIGNGREPEPISEEEIGNIRRIVESGLPPVPWPYIPRGQEVYLESGPLKGLKGVVAEDSKEKWLVISVDLLQRSIAVRMERELVSLRLTFAAAKR